MWTLMRCERYTRKQDICSYDFIVLYHADEGTVGAYRRGRLLHSEYLEGSCVRGQRH